MRRICFFALLLMTLSVAAKTDNIRILATSDTHGMFYPYNYALLQPNPTSLCNVASVVNERRNANTILVEAGDVIQDNGVEFFLQDSLEPMVAAMNHIGYDIWVSGNHEYNFGMANLQRILRQSTATFLTGNVYAPDGQQLGKDYVIIRKHGIRIGIIGMVTPNIVNWDKVNLEGWKVTNPVEETAALIKQLRKKTDILIAVEHMGMESEYGTPGSGARELAMACPELDLIVAAHAHVSYIDSVVNGVPVVANKSWCRTMVQVDFQRGKDGKWTIHPELIDVSRYAPDSATVALLEPYHQRALDNARQAIGKVQGGDLIPANQNPTVPDPFIEDTPWPDLIAAAMRYYSGADVAAAFIVQTSATLLDGQPLTKADGAILYKYSNTMYKMRMTGRQLHKYLEWTATFFRTWHTGESITFSDSFAPFNFDMLTGVDYEINISRPDGQRIENLCWSNTKIPVQDTDTFTLAVSNYRANTQLRNPGIIFSEEDGLPEVVEIDMCSNIGNVREIICAYIRDVLHGVVVPTCDHNWRLTGVPAGTPAEYHIPRH